MVMAGEVTGDVPHGSEFGIDTLSLRRMEDVSRLFNRRTRDFHFTDHTAKEFI